MKRVLVTISALLVSLSLVWIAANAASPWPGKAPQETPTPPQKSPVVLEVEDAIQEKIEAERATTIFFWEQTIAIEDTQISSNGQWATSLLAPLNEETDISPETEPALAISAKIDGEWQVWFPNTPGWLEMIANAPGDVLSPELKEVYRLMNIETAYNIPTSALGGYLLPWDAGISYYLTGSTCHDDYVTSGSAHYAFDFAYNRTMWDILAAKSGEVWLWQDDVPTCYEPSCWDTQPVGNYLVLRDTSTNPVTYQLYLHLKQESIPDEIKVQGHPIVQGQFIGIVDNTGQSSGSHLHFQVQVPRWPGDEETYWMGSVDITFDDVAVNGGRPRIQDPAYCLDFNFCDRPGDVCETSQLYYTSQNVRQGVIDTTPPIGEITKPLTGETYGASLPLEGWAQDLGNPQQPPIGLESAQFMAYYNGTWHDIGPVFNSQVFSYTWNWCSDGVPDGPASVALRLKDFHGNQTPGLPGLQHITKQYACPPQPSPPACQPASNQIAIFSEINYQGDCQILGVGNYSNSIGFGSVGNDNTRSIILGSLVDAHLFTEASYLGRTETIQADDANLSENLTGNGTLSSLKVFTATITLGGSSPADFFGALVNRDSLSAPTAGVTAPFSDTLEGDTSDWSFSPYWQISTQQARSATHSWHYGIEALGNYDDGSRNFGFLATPVITLPVTSNPYILQFFYWNETESPYAHWDQRWMQVSVDGGPFTDAYQLTDDPVGGWLKARINLLPYYSDPDVEHTIQVGFSFDTIDAYNNGYEGWYIDDIQIAAEPAASCPADGNDTPATATEIDYGSTTNAAICPGWDFDYYTFTGSAGDRVVADIDAKTSGSELDGYLFLLDSDGSSELAESDDEILFQVQDPLLGYVLPRDGEYYLKMRAWDHPTGMGEYSLELFTDNQNPSVSLDFPPEDEFLPLGVFTFTAQASDAGSGIHYVQFLYHGGDWLTDDWMELAVDYDGRDGWNTTFDTSGLSDGEIISVYVRAFDWAGNWSHAAAWNVGIDAKPPTVTIDPLPNPSDSTALHLKWSATDSGSGIETVNVEQRIGSDWENLLTDTTETKYWFIGQSGNDYAFRANARDRVGYQSTSAATNSTIPGMATLCSNPDAWDASASDNDNDFAHATTIASGEAAQTHNFCNPAATDRLNDQDWLSFTAEAGREYMLIARPLGESAAVTVRFYAANGTTLLQETIPSEFGQFTLARWLAPQSGVIYVQLRHNDGRVAGNGVSYTIQLYDTIAYLPQIYR